MNCKWCNNGLCRLYQYWFSNRKTIAILGSFYRGAKVNINVVALGKKTRKKVCHISFTISFLRGNWNDSGRSTTHPTTVPNLRTCTIFRTLRKNLLDQFSIIIFGQWPLSLKSLILLRTEGSGTKSISRKNGHCPKIMREHWSMYFSQNSKIVQVRLFGRVEYRVLQSAAL